MDNPRSRSSSVSSNVDEKGIIWDKFLQCVNLGDREQLQDLLAGETEEDKDTILTTFLTNTYLNDDSFYKHDEDLLNEAQMLLGPRYATYETGFAYQAVSGI